MQRLRTLPAGLAALATVVALIGALNAALTAQRDRHPLLATNGVLESQLLHQAVALDGAVPPSPERFDEIGRTFDIALGEALASVDHGTEERELLLEQSQLAARWRTAARRFLDRGRGHDTLNAQRRGVLLQRFSAKNTELRDRLTAAEARADRRSRQSGMLMLLMLAALALTAAGIAAVRAWRRHAARAVETRQLLMEDRRHREEQEEFTRALQGARTEREAQRMLKRQLERTLQEGRATVLNRNDRDNKLEAATAVPADSPLSGTVPDAEPGDCLAVRFGRSHARTDGHVPLMGCELCGALPGSVTCVPSLVGGEVIGSVLIESEDPLDEGGQRRLSEAVAHAAPVLASMRNLRLAETRASTDALTGLPNRRAAEETLKRMLAQADRSGVPYSVALFDLDHFKSVNDLYGHDKGDQLLAAVGGVAGKTLRASDFVARFGGEEFLVVLPETDLEGALIACDQLRARIAGIRLPGVVDNPTASFGVAVFPHDGGEPEALLRGADRALYAAKSAGRNCVKALRVLQRPSTAVEETMDSAIEAALDFDGQVVPADVAG